MKTMRRTPNQQHGAALIVLLSVLVLGIAWYTVGALGRAAPSTAQREIRTGMALQIAKRALLDYVAKEAALPSNPIPGRLPCPEPLAPAAGTEGIAAGCSDNTATFVGRLPWRTLGVEQIRDGHGEPLWYILGRGWRQSPINFGSLDEIEIDGVNRQAVALIIAPGAALNTLTDPATPPASCPRVNQLPRPVAAPYDPARFLECFRNATPAPGSEPQYNRTNAPPWTNDRIIILTAAEVLEAIAAPVADRLQRQVAPAMNDFRTTTSVASWGQSFLPYASTWDSALVTTSPPLNNLCGNSDVYAGMPPTATVAAGTCNTNWSSGSASGMVGFGSCVPGAADMRCDFTAVLPGLVTPRITATAPRIAHSFRFFDPSTIQISRNGGPWQNASVQNYSGGVNSGSGNATVQFDVVFPLLSIAETIVVRIPHPSDALLADTRAAWFLNNSWHRYTYYAVTRRVTVNPGTAECTPGGGNVSGCLTVTGMVAPTNDKRLVLVLMGRAPIAPATWPSANPSDYMEGANATPTDRIFEMTRVTAAFNDRVAACPFQYAIQGGTPVSLCN